MSVKQLSAHMRAQEAARIVAAKAFIENEEHIESGHLVLIPDKKVAFWKSRRLNLDAASMALITILVAKPNAWHTREDILQAAMGIIPDNEALNIAARKLRSKLRKADFKCQYFTRYGNRFKWDSDHA